MPAGGLVRGETPLKPLFVCRHSPEDQPGLLAEVLDERGCPWVDCRSYEADAPSFDRRQHGGLLVLGGAMNADETTGHPFLAREREWLALAAKEQVPVLGICLGAQLLARALNARVYKNHVPEIGWEPVRFTLSRPLG